MPEVVTREYVKKQITILRKSKSIKTGSRPLYRIQLNFSLLSQNFHEPLVTVVGFLFKAVFQSSF
jgi:hypothetical protein